MRNNNNEFLEIRPSVSTGATQLKLDFLLFEYQTDNIAPIVDSMVKVLEWVIRYCDLMISLLLRLYDYQLCP